jgi:hypothetical protein
MKYLFIDIRKSDEVFARSIENSIKNTKHPQNAQNNNNSVAEYEVYHIPMYMIKFNKEMIINHTRYYDEIYIVCNSASRSQFIKDKYFSEYINIKVSKSLQFNNLNLGVNNISLNNGSFTVKVIGSDNFNIYSILRITQILLGTLIIVLGGYTYFSIYALKNNYYVSKISLIPLTILLLFGLMALTNGLTSTCSITTIFMDYLN